MKSYDDSFAHLRSQIEIIGDPRPAVDRPPRHDDDNPGPSIFRSWVEDASLGDLTLPGLYVGRSDVKRVSFRGSDLHFSCFNWSDIIECDFGWTDLSRSDLRATRFARCDFSNANLSGADLRGSRFESCIFEGASMRGAILYGRRKLLGLLAIGSDQRALPLSPAQRLEVHWSAEAPQPGGG